MANGIFAFNLKALLYATQAKEVLFLLYVFYKYINLFRDLFVFLKILCLQICHFSV